MHYGRENNRAGQASGHRIEDPGRKTALDYLRASAVILVLYHHAILAYTTFAAVDFENPVATPTPVVNGQHWIGFDLMVAWNETFFMPLLFFISGIFVWQGLKNKGIKPYLWGRLVRLGLPFAMGVLFLIPLAYYPARLQVGQTTGTGADYGRFWLGMIGSGFGTAGPLWFLWLLLAFDTMAALIYRGAPIWEALTRGRPALIFERPGLFSTALIGISILAYLPPALIAGPLTWIGIGPFHAQAGRLLLYVVYFLAGTGIGAYGVDRSAIRADGRLAVTWPGWLTAGCIAFALFILMVAVVKPGERTLVSEIAFAFSCAATVIGMTGLFLRIATRRTGVLDSLGNNAYGIYLVHYGFVTWLQYLLLESPLSPVLKGMAVFLAALALSWGTAAGLRRLPFVAKVI